MGNNSVGSTLNELVLILESPLEELFVETMLAFSKTWGDMKAIRSDFKKVTTIVREQVNLSLKDRLENLDKFRRNLIVNDFRKGVQNKYKLFFATKKCFSDINFF